MADKTNKKNDDDQEPGNKDPGNQLPNDAFDGDLGFAADPDPSDASNSQREVAPNSDRPFIPQDRPAKPIPVDSHDGSDPSDSDSEGVTSERVTSVGDTWVPEQVPPLPGQEDTADSQSVVDTWVPDNAIPGADLAGDEPQTDIDTMKTWVPPDGEAPPSDNSPTNQETNSSSEETGDTNDPNSTWVPSSTPTFDGSEHPVSEESAVDQPSELDPEQTWVPSSTPTFDGSEAASVEDPGKTWVPSDTPTADGIDNPGITAGNGDDQPGPDDVDKTWVPTGTPTHHEFSFENAEEATSNSDDPNKTWVPSETPTVDGIEVANENVDPRSDTVIIPDGSEGQTSATGTVVIDHDADADADAAAGLTDSANAGTVVSDMQADGDVFGKTIGMRDLSEGEEDKWADDESANDTAVIELPDEADVDDKSRRTQIWQTQSADGLSSALTIRNAPVSGDSGFADMLKSDQPDYQIVKKLAEGGMGAVYIAKQTSLGRELAIKTLKPLSKKQTKTYQDQGRISQIQNQRREMFLSEALVTGNLVHPHIIPIHDLCQTGDGAPFYSMKRVHGTPWNETIQDLSQEENLEILLKVCDAMAYAHHNGVVNRDLKPENVMLGEFGEVLVLDWGLAVPASKEHKGKFASPAAPFGAGTPAYMSPELWTGPAEAIGPWSDIYLLGAILFEAITGETPHEFPEPDSSTGNTGLWMIIDKVVRQNTIRATEHGGELMDIAVRAMSTAPKLRHKSVLEFQDAVKEFQKHEESRHLSARASQSIAGADPTSSRQGYQNYQTAAALFEEATVAWPENHNARSGLRQTRYDYASLAHTKGDYDLGLQVAGQEVGDDFQLLSSKLKKSRKLRNGLKKATVTAICVVCFVGAFATYQAFMISQQKNEITELYGDKESLKEEAANAEQDKLLAENAKSQAVADQLIAEEAKIAAKLAEDKALKLRDEADKDKLEADKQRLLAEKASKEAEEKRLLAEQQKQEANEQLQLVNVKIKKAKTDKVRADIEVTNSQIASRIRNSDYSAALRSVEDLLASFENNEELSRLPKQEREDKLRELQAQKRQLQRRARQTESPVQAQAISSSGQLVVWGDEQGKLTVWKAGKDSSSLSDKPAFSQQLNAPVSAICVSEDEKTIVVAAASKIHVWIPESGERFALTEHNSTITTVVIDDRHLLSADDKGNIISWNLKQKKSLWSIRSSSAIRNLELMSDSNMFLYAGSRGGQSADVLAYELPPNSNPTARPVRKGQLRLPRDRNNPPLRIAVSPDESLLVISNSRNGEVISLPRRSAEELSGRDQFPFAHATDLQNQGVANWVKSEHQRPVNDIVFSADGKRVVTASDDRSVGVWSVSDSGNLSLVERLEGHGAKVNSAGFLDTAGQKVLSASADRFCRFWSVENYRNEQQELERAFGLESIDSGFRVRPPANPGIAPDERRLSKTSTQGKLPKQTAEITHRKNRWITANLDSRNHKTPVQTDHIVINANGVVQRGSLNTVTLSEDGTRLITGADDGTAVIWDTATGIQIRGMSTRATYDSEKGSFDEGHAFNVARLRFLPPNGKVMITTGFDGTLCLWNADTQFSGAGRQEIRIPGLGLVNAIATSPDGQLIVTSASTENETRGGGSAIVWKTENLLSESTPVPVAQLTGFHRAEVSALAVNSDSTLIATGARDGRIAVWATATGRQIIGGQVHVKDTIVSHLEWMPDGHLLSAGFDGRILLLKPDMAAAVPQDNSTARPGRFIVAKTFEHDRIPVERVAFGKNKTRFVTISVRTDRKTKQISSELELWNISGAKTAQRIRPAIVGGKQPDRIVAINWSQDGDRLAAVVDDNLQIFDANSWKILNVMDAPGLGISDAVFAPSELSGDDSQDVIATFDGTASHLWNLNDRSHVADFRPLFAIQSTALLQNEATNLLLTGDRAIRVFEAGESSEEFGQTISKISDPHGGVITSIRFSPVSSTEIHQFVSSGADGTAILWNWDSTTSEATISRRLWKGQQSLTSVAWNNTGSRVLLTEDSGVLHLVPIEDPNAATIEFNVAPDIAVQVSTSDFSSGGNFVSVAGQIVSSGESCGWVFDVSDPTNPELHCTINGGHEAGGIRDICFLPDSPYMLTAGIDGAALIWNWLPSRAEEGPLAAYEAYQLLAKDSPRAHQAAINAVAVSSSGVIATACENGTAIIWQNPFHSSSVN